MLLSHAHFTDRKGHLGVHKAWALTPRPKTPPAPLRTVLSCWTKTCTTRSSGQLLPNKLDGLPVTHTPVSQLPVSRCCAFSLLYPQASRIVLGTRRHGHMH